MKTAQFKWNSKSWNLVQGEDSIVPQLILVFGERMLLEDSKWFDGIQQKYPDSNIVSCSSSGDILGSELLEESISATAIEFEKTQVVIHEVDTDKVNGSAEAGKEIASQFDQDGLKGVILISNGHKVNGSYLVEGVREVFEDKIQVSGGLAGDAARFEKTLVGWNKVPEENSIIGIGLYGDNIQLGFGSNGGWDAFGPERIVTRSNDNILLELDHRNALDLYKEYLGDKAKELPGSALLFPMNLTLENGETVVRTVLSVDDETKSMTFAGNLPEGAKAQLMKANFEKLITASELAAEHAVGDITDPDLLLLISCVGRRLILGQMAEEEIESAADSAGGKPTVTGFYSYGEISPIDGIRNCSLHNQTMTITALKEV